MPAEADPEIQEVEKDVAPEAVLDEIEARQRPPRASAPHSTAGQGRAAAPIDSDENHTLRLGWGR
jgi:hypothetical protein